MLYVVLIVIGLILAGALLVWPVLKGGPAEQESIPAVDGRVAPATLEGVLVGQLVDGSITRAQYRAALSRLAQRDDERHPMSVPDIEPPESSS
ncbi:hypothetical protein [Actinoplanes sp. NPDC023714]|uniref:hypothetical protein n=1 Tax=Actinoplanes sp. NPDC023714 TaxID=3154322 RepID=UPI0033C620A9